MSQKGNPIPVYLILIQIKIYILNINTVGNWDTEANITDKTFLMLYPDLVVPVTQKHQMIDFLSNQAPYLFLLEVAHKRA